MFLRRQDPYMLVVSMTGVKMGDRLLLVGCSHGGRLGAIAVKVGLSGRAAAVVPDESSAARARKGAAEAGALVDVDIAPPTRLTSDDASFDLVVVDDAAGAIGSLSAADRAIAIRELRRVVRPGGRVVIIGTTPPSGLRGLLSSAPRTPSFAASGDVSTTLQNAGFKSVRTLAERSGLIFIEGIKPRDGG